MFAALKQKITPDNPHEQAAQSIYASCLEQTRKPVFYKILAIDDTFEGRFDLLLVHLFCIFHVTEDSDIDFKQTLFDVTFADMDQTLREMGIGDMGIPKHMRRMMKAFNGRMHVYEETFDKGDDFKEALRRNLYGTKNAASNEQIDKLCSYIRLTVGALKDLPPDSILQGHFQFTDGDFL